MKSSRVVLSEWDWAVSESDNYLDIPWPRVQRDIGVDQVQWLLKRPKEHCQLVLDRSGTRVKLIAEFYDDRALTTYHLMWAK